MTEPARQSRPRQSGLARTLDGEAVRYGTDEPLLSREIALVDLLDRLLAGGVVLTGDITLAIADVDLVHINLRALITSVRAEDASPWDT